MSGEKMISRDYLIELVSYKLSYVLVLCTILFAWDLHICERYSIKPAHKKSMGDMVKIMLHTMFLTTVYLTCFYWFLFRFSTYITF